MTRYDKLIEGKELAHEIAKLTQKKNSILCALNKEVQLIDDNIKTWEQSLEESLNQIGLLDSQKTKVCKLASRDLEAISLATNQYSKELKQAMDKVGV